MLSQNIKKLRDTYGVSQEEFANEFGVVRQTVSKWEHGSSVPEASILDKMAEAFDLTVDQLINDDIEDLVIKQAKSRQLRRAMDCFIDALAEEVMQQIKNRLD